MKIFNNYGTDLNLYFNIYKPNSKVPEGSYSMKLTNGGQVYMNYINIFCLIIAQDLSTNNYLAMSIIDTTNLKTSDTDNIICNIVNSQATSPYLIPKSSDTSINLGYVSNNVNSYIDNSCSGGFCSDGYFQIGYNSNPKYGSNTSCVCVQNTLMSLYGTEPPSSNSNVLMILLIIFFIIIVIIIIIIIIIVAMKHKKNKKIE